MESQTISNGEINNCCKVADNLKEVERKDDRLIQQCSVCGNRHFRVRIDPADFTARRKP